MKRSHWIIFAAFAFVLWGALGGCGGTSISAYPAGGSGLHESCTRTLDCTAHLLCIEGTCVTGPYSPPVVDAAVSTDASPPPPDAPAAVLGQGCASSADCASGLTCVPSTLGGLKGGVCDLASFGIVPTGKTCSGECATAADCCELPPSAATAVYRYTDAGTYSYAHTCADLLAAIGGDPSVCVPGVSGPPTYLPTACNLYLDYCGASGGHACAAGTWACTNNMCSYTGSCTVGSTTTSLFGACPTLTRANRSLSLKCVAADGGSTGTCIGPATTCAVDADCLGRAPSDYPYYYYYYQYYQCTGTDCACYAGSCYYACNSTLDCGAGYACDSTSRVCKQVGCTPGAAGDSYCKAQMSKASAQCVTSGAGVGTCVIACNNDHDCSQYSGAIPGTTFGGSICFNGACTTVANYCGSDADCLGLTNTTTTMFCVTPPATPALVRSAQGT